MSYPQKGHADFLALGDWNAACWDCGKKFKASEMVRNWQGYYTCPKCYAPRQPQDFVRAIPDVQTPPWTQPMPAWSFASFCDLESVQPIVDIGTVDCMVIGEPSISASTSAVAGVAIAGLAVSGVS